MKKHLKKKPISFLSNGELKERIASPESFRLNQPNRLTKKHFYIEVFFAVSCLKL